MPAQRTTRPSTATTSKTRETIAEARKKLTEAHEQGRHRRTVPNCPQCEKGQGSTKSGVKAAASTTKAAGNGRQTRKGVVPFPFREVTLISETYLAIKGLGEDFDLVSCPRCAALLPSGEKAETAHRGFHEQIDGLDQRA
jgi:hypothetical protein